MRTLLAVLVALTAGACSKKTAEADKVRVAAAADLAKAFSDIATTFKAKTGITVELELGSSGLLAKQIEQGAPFSLYAAANRSYVDQVVKAGRCDAATIELYARGRIVVWTPAKVAAPRTLAELADPRFTKIAIANPEHAPYGKAAKEALEHTGVWPQIQDRIVLGENVQATLVYAQKGNAEAAVVALSLAIATQGGTYLPVDPELHAPLDQALVVCGTGPGAENAKKLAELIGSPDGHEVMNRYGFLLPGEQLPTNPPPTAAAAPKTP